MLKHSYVACLHELLTASRHWCSTATCLRDPSLHTEDCLCYAVCGVEEAGTHQTCHAVFKAEIAPLIFICILLNALACCCKQADGIRTEHDQAGEGSSTQISGLHAVRQPPVEDGEWSWNIAAQVGRKLDLPNSLVLQ